MAGRHRPGHRLLRRDRRVDVADLPADNRAFFAEQFLITDDNVAEFATPATDAADFECDNVFDRVAGPLS